jgi:HTH-type transcriptional regulator / antitoxin HipB
MKSPNEILKDARKAKGITQKNMGEALKMPQSHLSKIELGLTDPRLSSLTEIARYLELEPVLVPRRYLPAVMAIINQENSQEPAWQPDEDEDNEQ